MLQLSRFNKHWLPVVLILGVGILVRVIQFGQLPPGLYHDEAWNGLDAVRTLGGDWKIFYPDNFGREPLFIWFTALSIKVLGSTPFAVRLPALLLGSLTLPVCYLMTRELFGRHVALWALAIMAFTLWPIHLSRIGFRVVGLPLFIGLAIWQVARGYKTGRLRHWVLGGVLYGVAFYTYLAVRFTPIAIAAFLLYLVMILRLRPSRILVYGSLAFSAAYVITALPLGIYLVANPDMLLVRTEQTSLLNLTAPLGELARTLASSFVHTLGMFNIQGDALMRHNVSSRPVFDIVTGLVFWGGCYKSLRRSRQAEYAFVLIWVAVMLGPTILTLGAPMYLRATGVWPALAILPALGLDWIRELVERRLGIKLAFATVGVVIATGLVTTTWDYFVRYPQMEQTKYAFEDAALQLAQEVNSFLETGWTRGMVSVKATPPRADRRVYADRQLWKDWLTARFLVPSSSSFIVPGSQGRGGTPDQAPLPTVLYSWWNPDYPGYWLPEIDWLPRHSRIEMHIGPSAKMRRTPDAEPEIYPAYIAFLATPYETQPASIAHFEPGFELVESTTGWSEGRLQVHLAWLTQQPISLDYTVFARVEQNGNIVAQHDDGPMGGCPELIGCFPTSHWRPGDIVVDDFQFTLPRAWDPQRDKVWLGAYHGSDGKRLEISGNPSRVVEGQLLLFPTEAAQ